MALMLYRAYRLLSLLLWAFVAQPVLMLFGDWGYIYYYAGLGALAAERGLVGAAVYMWRLRHPLWVAQIAHQMLVEAEHGDHPDYVQDHYRRVRDVALTWAEAEEPGVTRRAWALRQELLRKVDAASKPEPTDST